LKNEENLSPKEQIAYYTTKLAHAQQALKDLSNVVNYIETENNNEHKVKRMRTLSGLAAHYKALDKDTAITQHFLRQKVLSGEIPSIMAGNKRLIAIEDVDDFLTRKTHVGNTKQESQQ